MAKGNLFLGTAARSVGDVVMYRREGSQVSRVRVRKIANPKTDAQCEQRAFMAAVVKFFQPYADVLNRSYQGLSRARSYAKFLKTNVNLVRNSGIYIPKTLGFVPMPLKLSAGSLVFNSIEVKSDGILIKTGTYSAAANGTIGVLSTELVKCGLKNGDVVTLIGAYQETGDPSVMPYVPVYGQFEINTSSDIVFNDAVPGFAFNGLDQGEDECAISLDYSNQRGLAFIVARNIEGEWKRSDSIMAIADSVLTRFTGADAKALAIESYKGAAASDNPLVYLDGKEL